MNSLDGTSASLDKLTVSCRLCLSVNSKLYQLFHFDETESLAVPLYMKVTLCTNVSVSKFDMLPQKICQNCLNYVNDWYIFRKKCLKINAFLKQKVYSQCDVGNYNKPKEKNVEISKDKEVMEKNCALKNSEGLTKGNKISEGSLFSDVDNNTFKGSGTDLIKGKCDVNKVPKELTEARKKKYKCSLCPDSFYYLNDLKQHKNFIHTFEKPSMSKKMLPVADPDIRLEGINMRTRYEMKCCNTVFFSKLKFRKHYVEQHPGEKPFMCETCGKKDFISEETLKRHKVLHTGKFRCEICSKTFTCNAILMLHKRDKHENDKPFVCDVCGKRFVTELLMNYHKRFHTGEKKYVCEECGLAVVTSSSLAKHKRIHSKEKPHECYICGKGFIIKGRLVEHLRVHTGERPYCCQVCQKSFTMKDKLKRHMRVHSGEKLFSCEYCGNNYSTRYGLSVHLKSHLAKYS